MLTGADLDGLRKSLGVDVQPGIARAYPDLAALVYSIIDDKVASIPWLADGWHNAVADLRKNNPDDLVALYPANNVLGLKGTGSPDWLDADQRAAWTTVAKEVNAAVAKYAADDAAAGKARLEMLYARADFWDATYKVAAFLGKLPGKVASTFWSTLGTPEKLAIGAVALLLVAFVVIGLLRGVKSVKG